MVDLAKTLPRWLFGDDIDGDRNFVIHTEHPRFIVEVHDRADGGYDSQADDFTWLDEPPMDAALLARLASESGEAFAEYDRRLENESES